MVNDHDQTKQQNADVSSVWHISPRLWHKHICAPCVCSRMSSMTTWFMQTAWYHSQSDVRVKSLLLGHSQHERVYGLCKLHKLVSWNSPGVPTLHLLNTFSSWLNDPRLLAYSKSMWTMEKQLQFKRKSGFLFALSQMGIWTCFFNIDVTIILYLPT